MSYYRDALEPLILFLAKVLFGMSTLTHEYKGSGDSLYDYARVGVLAVISLVLAVILIMTLRKQFNLESVRNAIFIYARYYLGFFMLTYGFSKIFEGQFLYTIPFVKLEQTIGNTSPMGLLWTLMGSSRPYATFGGVLEIIAGYLLLFKRTKTIGLLFTIIVMVNVVLMNFCYDVPVKLFSTHLLLISMLLLFPDLKAIYDFFILRRVTHLPSIQQTEVKYKTTRRVGQGIAIVMLTILSCSPYMGTASPQASKMDGMYTADLFVLEQDTLPPVISDSLRWESLIISQGLSRVTRMNDSIERFKVTIDTVSNKIIFEQRTESAKKYALTYSEKNGNLLLTGLWKGKNLAAVFTKKKYSDYRLTNRGFHWISESQYNY